MIRSVQLQPILALYRLSSGVNHQPPAIWQSHRSRIGSAVQSDPLFYRPSLAVIRDSRSHSTRSCPVKPQPIPVNHSTSQEGDIARIHVRQPSEVQPILRDGVICPVPPPLDRGVVMPLASEEDHCWVEHIIFGIGEPIAGFHPEMQSVLRYS